MEYNDFRSTTAGRFSLWLWSDQGKLDLSWFMRGLIFAFAIQISLTLFGRLDLSALNQRQQIGTFALLILAMGLCWVVLERIAAKAKERLRHGISLSDQDLFLEMKKAGFVVNITASEETFSRPRGRPKGAGGFADSDGPLVEKMREMITANPSLTVFGAAAQFAGEAAGNASFERKQRRLADRYREVFGE